MKPPNDVAEEPGAPQNGVGDSKKRKRSRKRPASAMKKFSRGEPIATRKVID